MSACVCFQTDLWCQNLRDPHEEGVVSIWGSLGKGSSPGGGGATPRPGLCLSSQRVSQVKYEVTKDSRELGFQQGTSPVLRVLGADSGRAAAAAFLLQASLPCLWPGLLPLGLGQHLSRPSGFTLRSASARLPGDMLSLPVCL